MDTIETLRRIITDIRTSVTTSPGDTSPDLREAVETRAARRAGGLRPDPKNPEIPQDLARYLSQVSAEANRITDEDIAGMLDAGYSEDAIFELTVCGAIGEGLARLERTLDLLEGAA